jgi:hypothetical protein
MEYGEDYSELCSFANIKYTPAWYYQQFPGFYNVECYKILANWKGGVRSEEQYLMDLERQCKENMEIEGEDNNENKKRKREEGESKL